MKKAAFSLNCTWSHLLFIFLAYVSGLWLYSVPFTGDQKVYVSTSLEMWKNNVWLYPTLMGEHTYIKPPLQLWATLVGWNLFGFNPFGTFFPSVAALLGTCFFLDRISKEINPKQISSTASLWFAGTFGAMTYSCVAQMDIWLALLFTSAWWGVVKFMGSRQARYIYFAFGCAGLCSLVKSPLHSVLWTLGLICFFLFSAQSKIWRNSHLYLSLLFGVALSLVWFVIVYVTDYQAFWVLYVKGETLGKSAGNNGPLINMWRDFFISLAPWCLIIVAAVITGLKGSRNSHLSTRLFWSWSLPPMVFFSVFPYRTETYLFVLAPVFGLIANGMTAESLKRSPLLRLTVRFNALIIGALIVYVCVLFILANIVSPVWIFVIGVAGLSAAILFFRLETRSALIASLFLVMGIRLAAVSLGEDDVAGLRQFVRLHSDREIAFEDTGRNWWNEIGLLSVAARKPGLRLMKEEDVYRGLSKGSALIFTNEQWPIWIPKIKKALSKDQGSKQVHEYSWWRWNRGFLFPRMSDLSILANRNSPEWNSKYRREFKIVYLQ